MYVCVQAIIVRSEQHVAIHQQYQESLQAAVDWLSQMKDKLSLCSDSSGDRNTISNKLDRLQVPAALWCQNDDSGDSIIAK